MVQNSTRKPRGRPPAYDADAALARVLDRFWLTGFAATSLDDLSAATGMNRPSLYGAFGDKRALFLKALRSYRDRGDGAMSAILGTGQPLRATLLDVTRAALDIYFSGDAGARGCFLTGAAMAGAATDPEVRDAVRETLEELDRAFARLLRQARERGEIGADADVEALGRLASSLLHTLSIRARAGTPRPTLERLAADGIEALLRAAC